MNKSTNMNATTLASSTGETKTLQRFLELQAEHEKAKEEMRAQGMTEEEILVELDIEL